MNFQMRYPLSILILVSIHLIFTNGVTIESTVGFQVHSWDNLDQWEQGFWKQVSWMKIDMHYMQKEFCSSQNNIQTDPRGCFVLNHDAPSTSYQYNSSADVLNYIQNPKYQPYFKYAHRNRKRADWPMVIALCFKYDFGDPCSNNTDGSNFRSLINTFYTQATKIISTYDLNLQFILDGSDAYECTPQEWRPWVRTWWGDESSAIFTSNNKSLGYDRLIVLDPPIIDVDPGYYIKKYAGDNFGKFYESVYPWLWWEPSDQMIISVCIDDYYTYGKPHTPGFLFAINIDPSLFMVYTGGKTGKAWNYELESGGSLKPVVTVVPYESSYLAIMAYSESILTDKKNHYQILPFDSILGTLTTTNPSVVIDTLPSLITSIDSIVVSTDAYNIPSKNALTTLVISGDDDGNYLLQMVTENIQFQTLSKGELVPCYLYAETQPRLKIFTYENSLVVMRSFITRSNAVYAQLWNFTDISNPVDMDFCLMIDVIPQPIASLGVDVITRGNRMDLIAAYATTSKDIKVAYYSGILEENGAIKINGTGSSLPVTVGTTPSVSMQLLNGEVMVLVTNGDGFCWNCEKHNKQTGPPLCQLKPAGNDSFEYVLNYHYGTLESWNQVVENSEMLSPCHGSIVTGNYDEGTYPSTTLFADAENTQLGVIGVHHGRPVLEVGDMLTCGMAAPYDGIKLDSWPLPVIPNM